MDIAEEKFEQARKKAEENYKSIGKVKCPYLNDFVYFNSEGFEHLLFKQWNRTRERQEQYIRIKLLPLAIKVLTQSHTLQEYKEAKEFLRLQSNSVWKKEMKNVKYYGFVAIINNALIKVIVKEVEGRNKNFHSIIPRWKTEVGESGNKIKRLHRGNPETD